MAIDFLAPGAVYPMLHPVRVVRGPLGGQDARSEKATPESVFTSRTPRKI